MPGIWKSYDPFNKEAMKAADDERKSRAEMILKRRRYFEGNHDKPLIVEPHQKDDNLILNLAGLTVDKMVDFVGSPTFAIEGETESDGERELLDAIVEHCDLEYLFPDALESGMIAGHYYLRLVMPEEGEPSPDNLPMLGILPPEMVTVFWDMSLYGMNKSALWYCISWETGSQTSKVQYRQDIVPIDLLMDSEYFEDFRDIAGQPFDESGWAIIEWKKGHRRNGSTSNEWEMIAGDVWNYPFAPIVDSKNARNSHSYYGRSELRDIHLNDGVNSVLSNTGRIIKFHAHPKTIMYGYDGDIQGTAIDGLWQIPNEGARTENLEMQSDLQSSMKMLDTLRASWFSQARVLDMATQKDKLGQITNFGVRMLFSEQTENCDDKRKRYGRSFTDAIQNLFFMVTKRPVKLVDEWDDPLPQNRVEVVQSVQAEQNIGVTSKHTLAKALDRDYEAELELKREEMDDSIDLQSGMMNAMAERGAIFGNNGGNSGTVEDDDNEDEGDDE